MVNKINKRHGWGAASRMYPIKQCLQNMLFPHDTQGQGSPYLANIPTVQSRIWASLIQRKLNHIVFNSEKVLKSDKLNPKF